MAPSRSICVTSASNRAWPRTIRLPLRPSLHSTDWMTEWRTTSWPIRRGRTSLNWSRLLAHIRRGKETGNKSIGWAGDAAEKIAGLFGKEAAKGVIKTEELNRVFGDKTLAAETMLLMLGYKKQGEEWQRPA